jgi:hypothetical protein
MPKTHTALSVTHIPMACYRTCGIMESFIFPFTPLSTLSSNTTFAYALDMTPQQRMRLSV